MKFDSRKNENTPSRNTNTPSDPWPSGYAHGLEAGGLLIASGVPPKDVARSALSLIERLPQCSRHPCVVADHHVQTSRQDHPLDGRLVCESCAREALRMGEADYYDLCEWRSDAAVLEGIAHVALRAWSGETEPPTASVGRPQLAPDGLGGIFALKPPTPDSPSFGVSPAVALIVDSLTGHPTAQSPINDLTDL